MKGLICYYSGSVNTKLACQYLAGNITNAKFDFFNAVTDSDPQLNEYDVVGFATFTDFGGVPYLTG
jgi:flavodoxin